ncbi:TonB-dependent receptor plug domain-containing protein [Colwelliaceae bacterium 6471]
MSYIQKALRCAITLMILLSSAALFADEYDDLEGSLADFYGDEDFVSIATGTKKLIAKAPSVASVITAQDIKNMGARNIVEVLDTVPGLHASRSGQSLAPEFWFRGISTTYTPQTLFMINGTSTKSVVRGDNHTKWGEFPVHSIERIEIIRGPGSALYGADAFSGVINVVTKKNNQKASNEVGAKIGSFNSKNAWANYFFSLGSWQLSTNLEFLASDGFEGTIERDTQSAFDQVGASFGAPAASLAPGRISVSFQSIDVFLSAENDIFNIEVGIQERANLGTGQGATEALDTYGESSGYKHIFSAATKEQTIAPELFISAKASYYGSSQEIVKDLHLFPPGAFFGAFPDGFIGSPSWEEETTHIEFTSRYAGLEKSDIILGMGYERQNLYQVTERKNFNADFTPRAGGLEDVSDTSEVYMPEADRESHYLYLQGITQLAPDWELTAGARYDNYSDFGSTFNPRIALVWSTSLKLTTKLLYGAAFRAPSFAELLTVNNPVSLGNPSLKPETIDTIELAFNYKHSPELSLNFNLYHYEIDDLITFVQNGDNGTATGQNQGQRTGNGFEAGLMFKANTDLTMHANIAYTKAKDDLVNKDVGEYPSLQAYFRSEWTVNNQLNLNTQITFVGDRDRVPGDNRPTLNDYTAVSISAKYQFTDNDLVAELTITNVFDEDIREPSSPGTTLGQINIPNDLPQAGRSILLGVTKSF